MTDIKKTTYPRPGYLIYKASRLFIRLNEARLASHGLVAGQIPVILALGRSGTLPQKELTRIGEVEQPTMACLLARMERDGLIERVPDPEDRRNNQVHLVPKGESAVPHVIQTLEIVNERAYIDFTDEEKEIFAQLLIRLINNLEALDKKS